MAHGVSNGNRRGKREWRPISEFHIFTLGVENGWADAGWDTKPNLTRETKLPGENRNREIEFPADHKQDRQPYPVDAQSADSDDHTCSCSIVCEVRQDESGRRE